MWSDLGSKKVTLARLENGWEKARTENGRRLLTLVMDPTRAAQRRWRDVDRYLRVIIPMASIIDDEEKAKERVRVDFLVSGLRGYVQGDEKRFLFCGGDETVLQGQENEFPLR